MKRALILTADMIDDPWGINRRLAERREARERGLTYVAPHVRRLAKCREVFGHA